MVRCGCPAPGPKPNLGKTDKKPQSIVFIRQHFEEDICPIGRGAAISEDYPTICRFLFPISQEILQGFGNKIFFVKFAVSLRIFQENPQSF